MLVLRSCHFWNLEAECTCFESESKCVWLLFLNRQYGDLMSLDLHIKSMATRAALRVMGRNHPNWDGVGRGRLCIHVHTMDFSKAHGRGDKERPLTQTSADSVVEHVRSLLTSPRECTALKGACYAPQIWKHIWSQSVQKPPQVHPDGPYCGGNVPRWGRIKCLIWFNMGHQQGVRKTSCIRATPNWFLLIYRDTNTQKQTNKAVRGGAVWTNLTIFEFEWIWIFNKEYWVSMNITKIFFEYLVLTKCYYIKDIVYP